MSRSRHIIAVLIVSVCSLGWAIMGARAEGHSALTTPFGRLLHSDPAGEQADFMVDSDQLDSGVSGASFLENRQSQATMAHLMRLRRPMADVDIRPGESDQRVPENTAAIYLNQGPPMIFASLAAGPALPDRYTAGFSHRPLYYEQRNLERCGKGFGCLQNPISGIQFLGNTMVLPYRLCSQPAACCVPAGGDCMTCQRYPVDCNLFPLDCRALATEAAAIAGFSFLLL